MDAVRKHTLSIGAKRPPRSASPTNFGGSQHRPFGERSLHQALEPKISLNNTDSPHTSELHPVPRSDPEMLFPKRYTCSVSSQDVIFTFRIIVFFSRFFSRFHFPERLCFLGLLWLLNPHRPARSFVRIKKLFPIFACDALMQRLAEGVPVCIHQRRIPPLLHNVINIDA